MADVRAAVPHKVTMYYERLRLERSARGLGSKGIDGYVGDKLAQFKKLVRIFFGYRLAYTDCLLGPSYPG